jgi:hypothetical protein
MSNWKEAISLVFPASAHMVQGYLESEGIRTMLKDEMTTQVNNMYSNAIGGVKVMVQSGEFEHAQQLLEAGGYLHPEKAATVELVTLTNETNKKQCPFCHSENIGKRKTPDILMLIASLILGMFFPIFRRNDVCFDCRKEWKYKR